MNKNKQQEIIQYYFISFIVYQEHKHQNYRSDYYKQVKNKEWKIRTYWLIPPITQVWQVRMLSIERVIGCQKNYLSEIFE